MSFFTWFRGDCAFGGVLDLAGCSLWGVFVGNYVRFVC